MVNSDAQEYLYSSEWHKCREENHSNEEAPCCKSGKHVYREENFSNFGRILESFHVKNVTFAEEFGLGKENPNRSEKNLQDVLFSTSKTEEKESATEVLNNYISKYC